MKSKDQDSNNSIELPEGLNLDDFLIMLKNTELADQKYIDSLIEERQISNAFQLANALLETETLTRFQVTAIANGKTKGLTLGNYIILDKIGEGGMGVVFKARHKRMDRIVALKVLPRESKKNKAVIDRFLREAQTAAKLTHPNIVATYDSDEAEDYHFIVMEYIKGSDLRARVKRRGPLSVSRAVDYVTQVARGLEYAHNEGIIHRDIKPANLLLDDQGTIKILDMGLARIEDPEADQSDLTHHGATMGTVDYMPPEQAIDTKSVDRRADLYSLGCTLYFLLTGKPPFKGETMLVKMLGHREKSPPNLIRRRKDVPQQLNVIYQKLLAKSPDNRYQSAGELITALESIQDETDEFEESIGTILPKTPDAKSELDSSLSFDSQTLPGKVLSLDLGPYETSWLKFNVSQVPLNFKVALIASLALNLISVFLIAGLMTGSEKPAPSPQPTVAITTDRTEPDLSEIGSVAMETELVDPNTLSTDSGEPSSENKSVQAASPSSQQAAAIAIIKKFYGNVTLNKSGEVIEVNLNSIRFTDAGLKHLKGLTSLISLNLSDTNITDAGLEHLRGLTGLISLNLNDTQVTDAGLSELKAALPKCMVVSPLLLPVDAIAEVRNLGGKVSLNQSSKVIYVSLSDTQITDAGLENLKVLTSLDTLYLDNTQITDAGLKHFNPDFPFEFPIFGTQFAPYP
ncbi:MAG: protein kinase domain-containing protein, partial [Pirellulales bacterium]